MLDTVVKIYQGLSKSGKLQGERMDSNTIYNTSIIQKVKLFMATVCRSILTCYYNSYVHDCRITWARILQTAKLKPNNHPPVKLLSRMLVKCHILTVLCIEPIHLYTYV